MYILPEFTGNKLLHHNAHISFWNKEIRSVQMRADDGSRANYFEYLVQEAIIIQQEKSKIRQIISTNDPISCT